LRAVTIWRERQVRGYQRSAGGPAQKQARELQTQSWLRPRPGQVSILIKCVAVLL
jgi:hypothetical protein